MIPSQVSRLDIYRSNYSSALSSSELKDTMTVDISSEIFDSGLRQTLMNIVDFLKFQDFSRLMLVYDAK